MDIRIPQSGAASGLSKGDVEKAAKFGVLWNEPQNFFGKRPARAYGEEMSKLTQPLRREGISAN